ncbi:tRNA dimethylallyltransferase [Lentimicrobium saccharophilum]|uniref:tRNA dimethylallyltransferase n=1 Tax=Lentimicrobium saccharophilum TaxID=1678841 RepID=A0A0S7C097_9BACT|nr:tRNA (adenosine(37)-N6)-dimethylallyltransferase MiaA [Lentimicrobium saccharophilum]GAP44315.1 tRNA dimethylallyltransferase [Lentimicrobium saccharophilum]
MSVFPPSCLIVIAGPTAVGKTDVAIAVARYFGCEIISADSRQFYRGLKIGTAAPSAEQLSAVKHHFVGHLSVKDAYDVSRYEKEALELLQRLFRENRFAVLTGGSGLYIQAVCDGFDELPDSDPRIRADLRDKLEREGLASLRALLRQSDPAYYGQVDLANPNRILRALEVSLTTGKPFSSFRKRDLADRPFSTVKICLDLPRHELHNRINARVDAMMTSGLLEEARHFYPERTLNALNTVGYKELFQYFDGLCSLEEAVEKIKTNTRRYARRQLTWFRKDKEVVWCRPDAEEVIRNITRHLPDYSG